MENNVAQQLHLPLPSIMPGTEVQTARAIFSPNEIAAAECNSLASMQLYTTREILDHLEVDHDGEDPDYVDSYLPSVGG